MRFDERGHADGAGQVGDFAEALRDGIERLLTVLLGRNGTAEEAEIVGAETLRDRKVGTR